MIRPLYRWKSVWFGVLVVAFLGWAWALSMHRMAFVEWREFFAKQASGEVRVIWGGVVPELRVGSAAIRNLNWNELPPAFSSEVLFTYDDPLSGARSAYGRDFIFAHWFLILLFLVPWSGWLAWRWRRVRRLIAEPG